MLKYEKWNNKWQSMSSGGSCPGCDEPLTWILFKEGHAMYVYDDSTEVPNTVGHSLYGTCCNTVCMDRAVERKKTAQSARKYVPMHELAGWDWHKQWASNNIPFEEESGPRKAAGKQKSKWLSAVVGKFFCGPKHLVRVMGVDLDAGSASFTVIDRMPHCLGRGVFCPGSHNSRTFRIEMIETFSYFSFMPKENDHLNELLCCLEVSEKEFRTRLDDVFSQIRSEMFESFNDVSNRPCLVRDL